MHSCSAVFTDQRPIESSGVEDQTNGCPYLVVVRIGAKSVPALLVAACFPDIFTLEASTKVVRSVHSYVLEMSETPNYRFLTGVSFLGIDC